MSPGTHCPRVQCPGRQLQGGSCDTMTTTIEEASDLGKVEELSDEEETKIIEGEIDTVNVDEYQRCKRCKSKVMYVNNTIVKCKKCNVMMKASKCDQSCTAKITVSDDKECVLTLFSNMVSKIVDEIEGPSISLRRLAAPKYIFCRLNAVNWTANMLSSFCVLLCRHVCMQTAVCVGHKCIQLAVYGMLMSACCIAAIACS